MMSAFKECEDVNFKQSRGHNGGDPIPMRVCIATYRIF